MSKVPDNQYFGTEKTMKILFACAARYAGTLFNLLYNSRQFFHR